MQTIPIRNLPIDAKRCRGADDKYKPTICDVRNGCQRHRQLDLDRQLRLPPDVTVLIEVMQLPRVVPHECHYFLSLE